jgi:NitT/TauT family transport system substrate-binding protein
MHPRPALHAIPLVAALVGVAVACAGCAGAPHDGGLRLGYFPNITHAQALYGIQEGLYARHLGSHPFKAVAFNAGPTAMEALLTGQIDATYVGPSPALSALAAAGGDVVRIVAGSASGGARFIVQPGLNLSSDSSLGGRTFASPQLGNTQDVSLKAYLKAHGHGTKDRGGDVQVINAANPDILTLFLQHQIDGAWVPEPWATRLVRDGGGSEFLDERSLWPGGRFVTTQVVTTRTYMENHPDQVRALLEAHVEATLAVQRGGPALLDVLNTAIEKAAGKRLPEALLAESFTKVDFTNDPLPETLYAFADKARSLGTLRGELPPASKAMDLRILNQILAGRNLPLVAQP